MVDVGGVPVGESDVFGCEAKKMCTVGEAEVGGRGMARGVVSEMDDMEVDEAEGDVT